MTSGCSESMCETSTVKSAPPSDPTAPPIPTTVDTEVDGNMSVGVANNVADQPWCAAAASANSATAGHALCANTLCMCGTSISGSTHNDVTSSANLRPLFTV